MIDPLTKEVFGDVILREGTREAAFVHAISAAGVAFRVTRFDHYSIIFAYIRIYFVQFHHNKEIRIRWNCTRKLDRSNV